jgi:hypothetical protein
MSGDPNAREEGFYWVVLGQNPPEICAPSGCRPIGSKMRLKSRVGHFLVEW